MRTGNQFVKVWVGGQAADAHADAALAAARV